MIDTTEVVSAPIEGKLAGIINQLWQRPLSLGNIKHKIPQNNCHENCQSLLVKNSILKYGVNALERSTGHTANVRTTIIFTQLSDNLVKFKGQ